MDLHPKFGFDIGTNDDIHIYTHPPKSYEKAHYYIRRLSGENRVTLNRNKKWLEREIKYFWPGFLMVLRKLGRVERSHMWLKLASAEEQSRCSYMLAQM